MTGQEIITGALQFRRVLEDNLYNSDIVYLLEEYGVKLRLMYPQGINELNLDEMNNDSEQGPIRLPSIMILFSSPVLSIGIYRSLNYCVDEIVRFLSENCKQPISNYLQSVNISFDMMNDLNNGDENLVLEYNEAYDKYQEFMMRHDNKLMKDQNKNIVEFIGFGIDDYSGETLVIYRDIDKEQMYHCISVYDFFNGDFENLY